MLGLCGHIPNSQIFLKLIVKEACTNEERS